MLASADFVTEYAPVKETSRSTERNGPRRVQGVELGVVLILLLSTGACNFVLVKLLYNSYGETNSFFVSQGINVLYCIYGGAIVYPRLLPGGIGNKLSAWLGLDPITPAMRAPTHQRRFFTMGVLDCFGTFLTAMGAVFTPGQYQTLLNQSLIPATMIASSAFLGTSYSRGQLIAAMLILSGAVVSIAPRLFTANVADGGRPDDEMHAYAVALYWASNLPMACSAVYKEARFSREPMDVTYLTQWVSLWQMLFGFALGPLQLLPGVGSSGGQSWDSICMSFRRGLACFLHLDDNGNASGLGSGLGSGSGGDWPAGSGCGTHHTLLLVGYVAVNFVFNTLGLWLTKHGGAVLNSISYSLLLPITTLLFAAPVLGPYRESAFPSTYAGLVIVMLGFGLWRYFEPLTEPVAMRAAAAATTGNIGQMAVAEVTARSGEGSLSSRGSLSCVAGHAPLMRFPRSPSPPATFQERVIGLGRIARRSKVAHVVPGLGQGQAAADPQVDANLASRQH